MKNAKTGVAASRVSWLVALGSTTWQKQRGEMSPSGFPLRILWVPLELQMLCG